MRRTLLGLAILAALGLAPVRAMANDDQIAQAIVTKFQAQKSTGALKDFKIGVKVEEGVVSLEGFVPTQAQLDLALDIARRVKGVKMVVNDIELDATKKSKPTHAVVAAEKVAALEEAEALGSEPASSRRPLNITKVTPVAVPADSLEQSAGLETEIDHADLAPRKAVRASAVEPVISAPPAVAAPEAVKAPQAARRPVGNQTPLAMAPSRTLGRGGVMQVSAMQPVAQQPMMQQQPMQQQPSAAPIPSYVPANGMGVAPAQYDHPQMPNYAWPSYASHPNYAAVTYPRQYSPSAWPYIGPFYPYPQVPLGWRKVTLEWDDGWWYLDFKNRHYR